MVTLESRVLISTKTRRARGRKKDEPTVQVLEFSYVFQGFQHTIFALEHFLFHSFSFNDFHAFSE